MALTGTRQVTLVIAFFSGYTRFMLSHQKVLAHSQLIIEDLLETLQREVGPPLALVKLEGDGLFLYAPKDGPTAPPEQAAALGRQVEAMLTAFRRRVQYLKATAFCKCQACTEVDRLRLKVVVHSGQAYVSRIGSALELAGVDVIIVHRLLKNSVEADEYVLLTDAACGDVRLPDGMALSRAQEVYPEIGAIGTLVAVPDRAATAAPVASDAPPDPFSAPYRILRQEIRREYAEVARQPDKGFHFHTGRRLAELLGYEAAELDAIPASAVESLAGTGNPFRLDPLALGERVVDVGCGAGFDTFIAARRVGPAGRVVGVDMTPEMAHKAQQGVRAGGFRNVQIALAYAEALPLPDGWADVVISNGVLNLCPNKLTVLREMHRVLKPGGRLQVGDILVQRPIPDAARHDIDLWTG